MNFKKDLLAESTAAQVRARMAVRQAVHCINGKLWREALGHLHSTLEEVIRAQNCDDLAEFLSVRLAQEKDPFGGGG